MLAGDGRTVSWTAFDMPLAMTKGTNRITFGYGTDRQRIRRYDQLSTGLVTTTYIGGKAMEEIVSNDGTDNRYYIGDFAVVSRFTSLSGTTVTTRYLQRDHLITVTVITVALR
jgi:hypothetical protein